MKIITHNIRINLLVRTCGIFVLTNVMFLTVELSLALEQIINNRLSLSFLWQVVFLSIVYSSGFILSVCYLIALLFLIDSMYSNNEMEIIKTLGLGDGRMFVALLPPSLTLSIIVAFIVFYLGPNSLGHINQIYANYLIYEYENLEDGVISSSADEFIEFRDGKIHAWKVDEQDSYYVSGELSDNSISYEEGSLKVPLTSGSLLSWSENRRFTQSLSDNLVFSFPIPQAVSNSVKSTPTIDLVNQELAGYDLSSRRDLDMRVELHERMAYAIASLFILPLVLAVNRRQHKRARGSSVLFSTLIFLVYATLMMNSMSPIRNGGGTLYFWTVHIVFHSAAYLVLLWPLMSRTLYRMKNIG